AALGGPAHLVVQLPQPVRQSARPEAVAARPGEGHADRSGTTPAAPSGDPGSGGQNAFVPYVREIVSEALGLPAERIDTGRTLHDLGFDSLMAFEIKHRIERDHGVDLPLGLVLERPTVDGLAALVAELTSRTPGTGR
ncbi:acyl carrier protein, partial [Streptomyces sp. W16]|uniref:acyl carrier protein n=1 Tax=Streptomyces sp. W16 TaxID=3076631 RepID=UPI00295AFB8B